MNCSGDHRHAVGKCKWLSESEIQIKNTLINPSSSSKLERLLRQESGEQIKKWIFEWTARSLSFWIRTSGERHKQPNTVSLTDWTEWMYGIWNGFSLKVIFQSVTRSITDDDLQKRTRKICEAPSESVFQERFLYLLSQMTIGQRLALSMPAWNRSAINKTNKVDHFIANSRLVI